MHARTHARTHRLNRSAIGPAFARALIRPRLPSSQITGEQFKRPWRQLKGKNKILMYCNFIDPNKLAEERVYQEIADQEVRGDLPPTQPHRTHLVTLAPSTAVKPQLGWCRCRVASGGPSCACAHRHAGNPLPHCMHPAPVRADAHPDW